jgi:TRAP-type C4-dicarboxylate transport system permease small subunit
MRAFVAACRKVSGWMNALAGAILFIMMMLTVVDVVLRSFGKPIIGTYEMVAVFGAMVVGFAVAETSWHRGHVYVDFLVANRSKAVQSGFFIGTRVVAILIFALLTRNLFLKANHLYRTGEVSMTLHLPYYPAAYALAFCFLIECLVLVSDILRVFITENQNE